MYEENILRIYLLTPSTKASSCHHNYTVLPYFPEYFFFRHQQKMRMVVSDYLSMLKFAYFLVASLIYHAVVSQNIASILKRRGTF